MFLYGINGFPDKRVPEIFETLLLLRFYHGGLTYSDLTDREDSGELFEAAKTVMRAYKQAERAAEQRAQAKLRR